MSAALLPGRSTNSRPLASYLQFERFLQQPANAFSVNLALGNQGARLEAITMASHGSPLFEAYVRNMKRLAWAEFIDSQSLIARPGAFRASLVETAEDGQPENLAASYNYHRHRMVSND